MVKNPPANAGDTGSIPDLGRFLHALEQLSLCATTTEGRAPQSPCSSTREATAMRDPRTTTRENPGQQ